MEGEKRKPGGRERPYSELRVVAKLYSFLAPLVGGAMLFVGVFALVFADLPSYISLLLGVLSIFFAAVYYFVLKAASQASYILFDIAFYAKGLSGRAERPFE